MSAVYLVKTPAGDRLVKAGSKTVAVNHAVKSMVSAKSVTASELVELMASGLTIEEAGKNASTEAETAKAADDGGEKEAA